MWGNDDFAAAAAVAAVGITEISFLCKFFYQSLKCKILTIPFGQFCPEAFVFEDSDPPVAAVVRLKVINLIIRNCISLNT